MVLLRRTGFCFVFLWLQLFAVSQNKVTFVITRTPSYHTQSEKIYLAGSFNNWNPGDEKMIFTSLDSRQALSLDLPAGRYEFKFTRGDWGRVECLEGGLPSKNRSIEIRQDTIIEFSIQDWADHFPKKERAGSATKNVQLLDSTFFIPQLNRFRRVWIYLPSSYSVSKKTYPVLYMHDGQNVFDNATSSYGEWGVDEALDSLGSRYKEIIVIAIDHGSEKRMNEYAPYYMEKYGQAEGDQYLRFLAETLKPYIDRRFRTKKESKSTFIAGSSMGGLISFYALLKFPKVFGGAGVFSPSFWIAPQLKNISKKQAEKVKGRIYFFAGQHESESMVPNILNVFGQMQNYSKAKMKTVIRAEGEHNEATWRAEFPEFYKWIVQ